MTYVNMPNGQLPYHLDNLACRQCGHKTIKNLVRGRYGDEPNLVYSWCPYCYDRRIISISIFG